MATHAAQLKTHFDEIQKNLGKTKSLGPQYKHANTFATDPVGKEFIEAKQKAESALAAFSTADVPVAEKKAFNDAYAELEKQKVAQYKRWSEGDFSEHKEVKAAFDGVNAVVTRLSATSPNAEVKKFGDEQKVSLGALQEDKEVEEAKSLSRSISSQYDVNSSKAMARQLDHDRSTIFRSLSEIDEAELKKQLSGKNPRIRAVSEEDELFTLRIKNIRNKEHKLFQSNDYPGVTIQRHGQGCCLHSIPNNQLGLAGYETFKTAYTALIEFARIEDPKGTFIFSIEKADPNAPFMIRSARDIERKILSALEAAGAVGAQVELDPELSAHLAMLENEIKEHSKARQLVSNERGVLEMIAKVRAKERELLKPAKLREIVGKDAAEWEQKVEARAAELDKLTPPKNESFTEKLEAAKTADPTLSDEQAVRDIAAEAKNITYSAPGLTDEQKVQEIGDKLQALDARIQAAQKTETLLNKQLQELKAHEDASKPKFDEIPELKSGGHIQRMAELGEKNANTLAEIKLEAEVLKQAAQDLGRGAPTPAVAQAITNTTATANTKLTEINRVGVQNQAVCTEVNDYHEKLEKAEAASAKPR